MANTQVTSLNFQFTKQGQDLSTQSLAGKTMIEFTKAQASSDVHYTDTADQIAAMTALGNVKQEVPINEVDAISDNQSTVKIPVVFEKSKIDADYQLLTIGLFAKPKDGQEVLYAVLGLQDPVYMHKTSNQSIYSIDMYVVVGTSSNVTLKVDPAGAVSNAQLQAVLKDYATIKYVDDSIKNNKVVLPDDLAYTDKDATVTGQYSFSKDAKGADGSTYVTANKLNSTVGPMDNWQKYKLTQDNGQAKPYSGDINNLKTAGDYYSTSTTNAPDGGARWFIRVMVSGSIVEQMAYADTWNMMYDRTFKNNSWTAWQKRMMYSDLTNGLNKKPDNNQVIHRDPNTGKATDKTDWDPGSLTVGSKQLYPMSQATDENDSKAKSSSDLNTLYWYEEK